VIRIDGWVAGAPGWSEVHGQRDADIRSWEAKLAVPPAVGAMVLVFLKRTGPHEAAPIRGMDGPVLLVAPHPRTVEIVRGATWHAFAVRPVPRTKPSDLVEVAAADAGALAGGADVLQLVGEG